MPCLLSPSVLCCRRNQNSHHFFFSYLSWRNSLNFWESFMSEQPSVFGSNTHSQVLLPTWIHTRTHVSQENDKKCGNLAGHAASAEGWCLTTIAVYIWHFVIFEKKHKQILSSVIHVLLRESEGGIIFLPVNHDRLDHSTEDDVEKKLDDKHLCFTSHYT